MKYDIFISYSTKDKEKVLVTVRELRSKGYRIWMDEEGISSGDQFKKAIVEGLDNSKMMLFSPHHIQTSLYGLKKKLVMRTDIRNVLFP